MRALLIALIMSAATTAADAQWLTFPTPGLPRTADGKPILTSATPRTLDGKPDLSGIWTGPGGNPRPIVGDLLPWVVEAAERHAENFYKERPMFRCLPSGPATFSQSDGGGGVWKRIVQTPTLIVILNDDLTFRQIFMDGRALEVNAIPSWMGYSVGHWEGDSLVVETAGFNDKTWVNDKGLQHTEALRMTERYTRSDLGHLRIEVSYTDANAYRKPLTLTVNSTSGADTGLLERVCEAGTEHWVGTVSDAKAAAVSVSPELLARYVGVYTGFWGANPRTVDVALIDGQLIIHINDDPTAEALIPLSPTLFQSPEGLTYDFLTNGDVPATDVVENHVSGGYQYARRK